MMKKLTETDAILCKNIEEAIAIKTIIGSFLTKTELKERIEKYGNIVMYKDKAWDEEKNVNSKYKITKASKILNKGVSKKELLRRIEKLEKVMIDNTEVKLVSQANPEEKSFEWMPKYLTQEEALKWGEARIPEIEGIKNELTELPEKWWTAVTENNLDVLTKWIGHSNIKAGKHLVGMVKYYDEYTIKKGYNSIDSPFCVDGFDFGQEITFEQFKKWALKEDDSKTEIPKITEVQVDCSELTKEHIQELADIVVDNGFELWGGTDYYGISIFLRFLEEKEFGIVAKDNDLKTITYQQFKDFYYKEKPLSIREVQVKVTSQEEANECAEIAKACGEKINKLEIKNDIEYFRKDRYQEYFQVLQESDNYKTISIQEYRERFGKSTEIDWSKAGQLVTSGITKAITLGKFNEDRFTGFIVKGLGSFDICETLIKSKFKLCTEPITLSN